MQIVAMIYGYARVSTNGQNLAQINAGGCVKIYPRAETATCRPP